MPRYYCDYCDTYLTHDSPSVRKQHNQGYKHKANVRNYFQQFEEQQTQSLIDQKVREHLGQTGVFQQVGAAFNQHLASLQYRPPVLHPPTLPIPGSTAVQTSMPTFRPPFPAPNPASGYTQSPGGMPTFRPPVAPVPISPSQANGLPTVSNMSATANVPYHNGPVGSSASTPAAFQHHTMSVPAPASNSVGAYSPSTPAESESGSSQEISRVPGSYVSFNSHLSAPVPFTAPSQGSFSYGQSNGSLTHSVQMLNSSASQPPGAPVG